MSNPISPNSRERQRLLGGLHTGMNITQVDLVRAIPLDLLWANPKDPPSAISKYPLSAILIYLVLVNPTRVWVKICASTTKMVGA
jgi:hypothetical protein